MKRVPVCLITMLLLVSTLYGQTELGRTRLGNKVESIAYVPRETNAGHIAILDGMQVLKMSANETGPLRVQTMFDFSKLGFHAQPTGMGYVSDEDLFVFAFNTQNSPTAILYLSNRHGKPAGTIVVNWPQEFADSNSYPEGIVWVPKNAPRYPGCFIFAAIQQAGFENSFLVVSRSGEVVAKIIPAIDQTQVNFFPTGLAYENGNLVVGDTDGNLYKLDLDGNLLAGPIHFDDAADIEGVAYAPQSDSVAITSNANGKLIFLDSGLNRKSIEKSYLAGLGLGNVLDVTWSNQTSEFLVNALGFEPTMNLPQIAAINSSITASRMVMNLNTFPSPPTRLEYLADSNEFAIFNRFSLARGFFFSDLNGNQTGFSSVTTLTPSTFTYIPSTQQFVVKPTTPTNVLYVYDRTNLSGGPSRIIDLAPLGISPISDVTYYHPEYPNGGQLLLTNLDHFYVIDLNGSLLAQYANTMRVTTVGAITSGPYAGDFAGIYSANNDLVIFTLP